MSRTTTNIIASCVCAIAAGFTIGVIVCESASSQTDEQAQAYLDCVANIQALYGHLPAYEVDAIIEARCDHMLEPEYNP